MNELIKISNRQTVSARELYEKLGFNPTHWARWTKKNIENNSFAIKDQDYWELALVASGETSRVYGNFAKDYELSIDFAKRLCMMARTEMGEKIRNYFIEIEKRYQQISRDLPNIREIAKKKRINFTDVLQNHGVTKSYHYINITTGMKKRLGIAGNKPKKECNDIELMEIAVSEDLAALTIIKNNPQNYYGCRDYSFQAAEKVNELTSLELPLLTK